jgi:hypothetical protein
MLGDKAYDRAERPARARNQAGHSKSLQQKTTVQLQQAYLQAAQAHREHVQQVEGTSGASQPAPTGWHEIIWPLCLAARLYGGFNELLGARVAYCGALFWERKLPADSCGATIKVHHVAALAFKVDCAPGKAAMVAKSND